MPVRPLNNKTAFTLIELLVVVAIIALLVAILVPALTDARNVAYRAVCAANMHQIAVAAVLYAEDNNGHVPYNQMRYPWPYATDAYFNFAGEFVSGNGHVLLMPYLNAAGDMNASLGFFAGDEEFFEGMWDIFRCPGLAYTSDIKALQRNYFSAGNLRGYTVSTTYNQWCGYEFEEGEVQWVPESSYRLDKLHPRFPLYSDFTFSWPQSPWVAAAWAHDGDEFKGLNTARADGSAEWISSQDDMIELVIPIPAVPDKQNRCYWMPTSR